VVTQVLPRASLQRVERLLVAAGEPIDIGLFLLLWAAAFVGGILLGLFFSPWAALTFGFLGAYLPLLWLRRAVDTRRRQITRETPDAVDLLVTCVESGLGLDASLIRVGEASSGPLGDEINRALREISVGRPRQEALLDLAVRTGVSDLEGVIRPIIQAERSGVSIGGALRIQADALRVRRRQRAQENAQRIPAKMTLVIATFFIPAVMLVAIAPAVFRLIDFFSNGWQ
jgi:tight adherence protein C